MAELYQFKIPIGDWSGDGHGKCTWFVVNSNKPVEEWRKAYFAAAKQWPQLQPDGDALARCPVEEWPLAEIKEVLSYEINMDDAHQSLAEYMLVFCQRKDPSLTFEFAEDVPMFPFYGFDKQQRHIGHVGYMLDMW